MTFDLKQDGAPHREELHDLIVRKLRGFDHVSEAEIQVLEQSFRGIRTFDVGEHLATIDQRLPYSTVLLRGWAARYRAVEDGSRQIVGIHVPGDFVDLHSFLLHKMDHSVVAMTACTIATMAHTYLRQISEQHPHLSRLLWLNTLVDAAVHRNTIVNIGRMTSVNRLANLLCEIYLRLEVVDQAADFTFEFPLRQADVADMLGLSAVHANRTIQDIRGRGLITWRSRTVQIHDWEQLVALGQFDPTYLSLRQEPR